LDFRLSLKRAASGNKFPLADALTTELHGFRDVPKFIKCKNNPSMTNARDNQNYDIENRYD